MVLAFKVQQYVVRKEIKRRLKRGVRDDELVMICVSPQQAGALIWNNDHEFTLGGEFYDIVKYETFEDAAVMYYCLSDTQEKALFKNLGDLVGHYHDKNNPASQVAFHLFQILGTSIGPKSIIEGVALYPPLRAFAHYFKHYSSPAIQKLVPPPWSLTQTI